MENLTTLTQYPVVQHEPVDVENAVTSGLQQRREKVPKYIDILGLKLSNQGRRCDAHKACGRHVQVGDKLSFKRIRIRAYSPFLNT